ncbi:hypothetical protein MNBD_PLANCTO02-469 [hydrothermal vent metagenome]|uniref:Uncharacterized protein n=1 Tax=hydrothermal vent metagenome TaxID=652676 RepID=A0A3B1DK49_9ZZZZ
MNCKEALNILEAVRPCSDDLNDPQFAEAVAWLNSDEECARLFDATQKLDTQISQAMQDVLVPAGLKKELIASLGLSEEEFSEEENSNKNESPVELVSPSFSRRRWLWVIVSSAACLVLGLYIWQQFPEEPKLLNIADLQKIATQQMGQWDQLSDYSGPFSNPKKVLGYHWTNGSIRTTPIPKNLPVDQNFHQPIALFGFQVKLDEAPHFDGVVLVVDAASIANPPKLDYFSASQANYITTDQGNFLTVVWRDENRVYICIVRDPQTLETLKSALSTSPA